MQLVLTIKSSYPYFVKHWPGKLRGITKHLCSTSTTYWPETGQSLKAICSESTGNRHTRKGLPGGSKGKNMFLKMLLKVGEYSIYWGYARHLLFVFQKTTLLALLAAVSCRQSFLHLCSKHFLTCEISKREAVVKPRRIFPIIHSLLGHSTPCWIHPHSQEQQSGETNKTSSLNTKTDKAAGTSHSSFALNFWELEAVTDSGMKLG